MPVHRCHNNGRILNCEQAQADKINGAVECAVQKPRWAEFYERYPGDEEEGWEEFDRILLGCPNRDVDGCAAPGGRWVPDE